MSNCLHVEVNLEKELFAVSKKKTDECHLKFLLNYLHPLQDTTDY